MIDFITRYVSAISLSAVAALSIFNIGYFWKIGLHFMGLIDLANLVYSAGLALVAIVLLIMVAWLVMPRKPALWKLIAAGIIGTSLSIWGVLKFSPRTLDPQLVENGAILLGFAITGIATLAWLLERYRITPVWNWPDSGLILLFSCVIMFQAGVFTSALELSDRLTYTVTTKSGDVLMDSRILRSAAAGFILASDGHIVFVPSAEIKSVKSVYDDKR
jgi:hypothetical protein